MRGISWPACAAALLAAIVAHPTRAAPPPHRIDRIAADRIMAGYERNIALADEFMRQYPVVIWGMSLRGTFFFLRGNFVQAAEDLRIASAGGAPRDRIWLFLARARRGDDGAAELATDQDTTKPGGWPAQAIEMFLGQRTPAQMQAAAAGAGQACEGLFFAAQWHLLHGDDAGAVAVYRETLDACPAGGTEYDYAITELVRLGRSGGTP